MMNEKILEAFSKALGAVKAAPLKAVTGVAAHKVAAVAVASTLALGGAGVGVGVHMANEKNDPVTEEATVSPKKDSSKKVATKSDTPASTETEAPVETAPTSAASDTAAPTSTSPTSTSPNDSNKTKTTNKTASEKTASSKKAPATEQTSSGKHPDQGKVDSIGDIWRNGVHYFCHGGPDTIYKLPDGFQGTDAQCESHMTQKEAQWRAEEEAARNQRDQAYQACFQKMAEKYPEFSNSYDSNDITDPNDRAEFDKARATLDVECVSPNRFNRYDYINNRQFVGAVYWAFAPDQINLTGQTKIFYCGQ